MSEIQDRIKTVYDSINDAENKAGRKAGSVKLVAVSKFHPSQAVIEAINCGQLLFGENRVQEAVAKFQQVRETHPSAELHIIGSLQRNKVKSALTCASCIQSVDRIELLQEIEKQAEKLGKQIKVLFEYHTAEDSKSGYTSLDDLLYSMDFVCQSKNIVPAGFMTMAPFTEDEIAIASSFKKLVSVQKEVQSRFSSFDLSELSMGMSNDYKIAIAEGATMVRIGTAIFGSRV